MSSVVGLSNVYGCLASEGFRLLVGVPPNDPRVDKQVNAAPTESWNSTCVTVTDNRPDNCLWLHSAIDSELVRALDRAVWAAATTPAINEQRRADDRTQTGYWAVCLQWAELITVLDRNAPSALSSLRASSESFPNTE